MTDIDLGVAAGGSRRRFLFSAAALGAMLIAGAGISKKIEPLRHRRKLRIAWLPQAVCVAPVLLAQKKGYFDRFNLDVELVGYDFHTPEFINAAGEGKVDAAVTMLHNWLIPMQQGLPVKLIAPVHGGCVRILGSRRAGITKVADLRGKRFGVPGGRVSDLSTMVYSIILQRNGIEPSDVQFTSVADENFGKAFAEGAIDAAGGIDPPLLMVQKANPDLVEIASNTSGPMAGTACCVTAAGPTLWRDDPQATAVLSMALALASDDVARNPSEAAALFAASSHFPEEILRQASTMNDYHAHHIAGTPKGLLADVISYVGILQQLKLFPAGLDPAAFARNHVSQVVCA